MTSSNKRDCSTHTHAFCGLCWRTIVSPNEKLNAMPAGVGGVGPWPAIPEETREATRRCITILVQLFEAEKCQVKPADTIQYTKPAGYNTIHEACSGYNTIHPQDDAPDRLPPVPGHGRTNEDVALTRQYPVHRRGCLVHHLPVLQAKTTVPLWQDASNGCVAVGGLG